MNPVAAMLVAYACISPVEAFALCVNTSDHKPDRLPITNIYKCPPTYAEVLDAAARSINSLGAALEKNAKQWDELNQTLERLNKHIGAAPAPFRVESPAAAVKPRAKRMVSRCDGSASECRMSRAECGAEFNDWYWKKGRRKFRCR